MGRRLKRGIRGLVAAAGVFLVAACGRDAQVGVGDLPVGQVPAPPTVTPLGTLPRPVPPTPTPTPSGCCEGAEGSPPGCPEPLCESCVCGVDAFCCESSWDAVCADIAANECAESCGCP